MYNLLVGVGVVLGKLLGLITNEEIKEGKKYFEFSEKVLLVILGISLLVVEFSVFSLSIFIGVLIYKLLARSSLFFLGFGVFLSSLVSLEFGLYIASLVFVYLLINSRDLKWRDVLINLIIFILPFGLFGVESFINANLNIFLGITVGGIIGPVAQLGRATE